MRIIKLILYLVITIYISIFVLALAIMGFIAEMLCDPNFPDAIGLKLRSYEKVIRSSINSPLYRRV